MRPRIFQLVLVLSLMSCSDGSHPTAPKPPTPKPPDVGQNTLTVTPAADSMQFGETRTFTATLRDSQGQVVTGWPVYWSSSDTSVANVDDHGVATARKPGVVQIVATSATLTANAALRIRALVPVIHVVSATITLGERVRLASLVSGTDSLGRPISPDSVLFSYHRPDTLTLGFAGRDLLGAGAGTAYLYVRFGTITDSALITVTPLHFTSVAGGCALTGSGEASCWADGWFGRYGDSEDASEFYLDFPARVAGSIRFSQISASRHYVCGVAIDGTAYCWGTNGFGQLGVGDTTHRCGEPGLKFGPCYSAPKAVAGGLRFKSVAAGVGSTCGITFDGLAYCWGVGQLGELGAAPSSTCDTAPFGTLLHYACSLVPIPVSGGLHFKAISVHQWYACGLTDAGAAYCWGGNLYDNLGVGARTDLKQCDSNEGAVPKVACTSAPLPVAGGLTFSSISAGGYHACALTSDGQAYCWGSYGGLGQGPRGASHSAVPIPVGGALRFVQIASNYASTCALSGSGTLYCWGQNDSQSDSPPTAFTLPGTVTGIASDDFGFCAIITSGDVYCWAGLGPITQYTAGKQWVPELIRSR